MSDRKTEYQEAVVEHVSDFTKAHKRDTKPMTGHTFATGVDVLAGVIVGGFTILVYELRAIRQAIEASRGSVSVEHGGEG